MTESRSIFKIKELEPVARDEAILIVEDDRVLLSELRQILDAEGFDVDVAETAAEAFEKIVRRSYRIFLLDLSLPGMHGLEFLTGVQKLAPDSIKIMLMEQPDMDVVVEALNHGADHVLLKPVQPEKLISAIMEKLSSRARDSSIRKDEVTVIVPVLNEEEAIGKVLAELREEGYENVLVVDGYSTDNTVSIAKEAGVTVIVQYGKGKTGALQTAIDFVETPYLLVMDGDYTYSAKDIDRFLPYAKRFDQIFGSRGDCGGNMRRSHKLGNWIINTALGVLVGSSVSDACTGMYMMKTEVAKQLELKSGGFSLEVEAAIQNIMHGEVTEIPISYRKRIGERKLCTWRHGFQILWTIIKLSFSYNPLFFLTALGSLFAVPGALILLQQFYLRLVFGNEGWSIGYVWLGLVLFLVGLNSFTIAIFTLISKRQERRIISHIKDLVG